MPVSDLTSVPLDAQLEREWLVTNGLGGFASSTVPGLNTRKYHGLLVAAMSPPGRQMVLLSRVEEFVFTKGQSFPLATCEYPGGIQPAGHEALRAFCHEPFPRWGYQADGWTIEKQLRLLPDENTVLLTYTLLGGDQSVDLYLKPLLALRGIHELMYQWNGRLAVENVETSDGMRGRHRIPATTRTPEFFFAHDGRIEGSPSWYLNTVYRCEQRRGYAGLEDLWMPGTLHWTLSPGQTAHFTCSTDPVDLARVLAKVGREGPGSRAIAPENADRGLTILSRAADQFVARGGADVGGGRVTFLLAGLPWHAQAGRDSLVSFCGLLLIPGRLTEARAVLSQFAALEKDGLMPSEIPADGSPPAYLGADVSLWFVDAVWHYLRYGGDAGFVIAELLPTIDSILRHYQEGTTLGIRATPDGLLASREPGAAVTWMDAKVGDWVITPRHGCAVEVNALWHNALRIGAAVARAAGQAARADDITAQADATKAAFNSRFWDSERRCCFDVIDGEGLDRSVRPNQLFAVSLSFPVLSIDRHHLVLDIARRELLTPVGLRTLASDDPNYTGRYFGGIISRDRAYHQGTVYPWLLGAYVTGMVKVRGRGQLVRAEARSLLQGCCDYLNGQGLGQLCELFDGDAPHQPGGLPASARSVAEVLRCYYEDVLDLGPVKFEFGASSPPKPGAEAVGGPPGSSARVAR